MARKPTQELSDDALELLTWLPEEPLGVAKHELASDAFGQEDSVAIGRVSAALDELRQSVGLFVRSNPDPYPDRGELKLYGVPLVVWKRAQKLARKYLRRRSAIDPVELI